MDILVKYFGHMFHYKAGGIEDICFFITKV